MMYTREKQLEAELKEIKNVTDIKDESESTAEMFNISSFGVDYTVEILVKKISTGSFIIPDFQREYVWSKNDASKFVESILLGLPVPGIFLFKEHDQGKHLVIDGQQRLKSLNNFYKGIIRDRSFKLSGLKSKWNGLAYEDLSEIDKERLDDGIIHTTIFKQDTPSDNMDSVYEVFERINTGGLKLSPQEIRSCVAHGEFNTLLFELNDNTNWRKIFGKKSTRLKDVELILRFIALTFDFNGYKKPMKKFLTDFMTDNRNPTVKDLNDIRNLFDEVFHLIFNSLGRKAFRPQGPLNAAVFDSLSANLAYKIKAGLKPTNEELKKVYSSLLADEDFHETYTRATSDESVLEQRFNIVRNTMNKYVS